jgi:uroporphyrin-III C-methyltransferase/precorrin-2 dehydrogenase/sirohydrochlorin ferrochelatase
MTRAGAPRFLPLAIDLRDARCVVVGGGAVGTRKIETLLRAGARVVVVAPEVSTALAAEAEADHLHWIPEPFRAEHLAGAALVVAATPDPALNAEITRGAAARGVLACDASSAEESRVIFGALLRRDDCTVAVFTDGADPARARRTRDHIADLLDRDRAGA